MAQKVMGKGSYIHCCKNLDNSVIHEPRVLTLWRVTLRPSCTGSHFDKAMAQKVMGKGSYIHCCKNLDNSVINEPGGSNLNGG